jgi:hypothetical protein
MSTPSGKYQVTQLPSSQLSTNCSHGTSELDWLVFITTLHGPNRKHRSQQFLNCCLRIRCRGNLFTEPLPSNGRLLWLHYSSLQGSCHSIFRCSPLFMTALNKGICLLSTSPFWYPQKDLCGDVSASETLGPCKYTALVPCCVSSHNQSSVSPFMEHNIPLPDSQVVATDLAWARWIQSTLIHPVPLRSLLILSSNTHLSSKWFLPLSFSYQNFWCTSHPSPQICDESELEVTVSDLPPSLSTVYFYIP